MNDKVILTCAVSGGHNNQGKNPDYPITPDQTYSIRLYDAASLSLLLESAGFTHINVHTDFSPHETDGDYGFMNSRMIATAQKR